MQTLTDEELRIFSSTTGRLVVNTYYEGDPMTPGGLPVAGGSISFDADSARQSAGEVVIVDATGEFIPKAYRAALSPYGAIARVEYVTEISGATASKQLGYFRIDAIPNLEEYLDLYRNGRWAHRGATIRLKLEGLLADVDDDKFEAPTQLVVGEPVWDTLAQLARKPITATLDDASISRALIFEESRLDAVYALAAMLEPGALPLELPDGTLGARAATDLDGEPDWTIPFGEEGRVLVPPRALTRDDFHNVFVSKGETEDQHQVVGRAAIIDGPLRAGGPMGYKPEIISSQLILTQEDAEADAIARRDAFLAGVLSDVELTCLPNPAAQLGDLVRFEYFDAEFTGELVKYSLVHGGLMTATIRTKTELSLWAG